MTLTLQEILSKLADQYDEVTLLELLNITSYDLVEAFYDRVEERYEYFNRELTVDEEPY